MKKLLFLVLLLAGTQAFSQHYEADVTEDTAASQLTKNNLRLVVTLESFITNHDVHIKDFQPISLSLGFDYLYKATKNIGFYGNVSLTDNEINVIQEPSISFPTSEIHQKNRYNISGIQLGAGMTFMLTNKGCVDDVRTSLTLYGFGEYYFFRQLEVSGDLNSSNSPFAASYNTVYHKLSYIQPFGYGIGGEIKVYFIYLGTKYFLSDFIKNSFKNDHNWPNMPKIKIYLKYKF